MPSRSFFAHHIPDKIRHVPGVSTVSRSNWFGGIYIDKRIFRAVRDRCSTVFELYRSITSREQMKAFVLDRKGCVVGRKLAHTYGWKLGDTIPLRGTIFPGNWDFVIRGIYEGAEAKTDESQFIFHWDYLNESIKKTAPRRANQVGIYLVGINDADRAAEISREIDALFRNALAETLTETEKAFALGFISMVEAIVAAETGIIDHCNVIIMAVMANTMAMSARERDVRCDSQSARFRTCIRTDADLWRIPADRKRVYSESSRPSRW
jgi:putative ABC transport system permease protein